MLLSGNMSDESPAAFSLELGDDLVEMRDWLHGFAESVIRPTAAEWDEREETPWPVLEEAAKIGLYSLDFYAQQYLDESGLGIPVAFEELFWGAAGIGLSLVGTSLGAGAVGARGAPEQVAAWRPPFFGRRRGWTGAWWAAGTNWTNGWRGCARAVAAASRRR